MRLSFEYSQIFFRISRRVALQLKSLYLFFWVVREDIDDIRRGLQLECLLDLHWPVCCLLLQCVLLCRGEMVVEEALDLL